MKTILVPVDLSSTSESGAAFAASWSREYGYNRIVLLKADKHAPSYNLMASGEFSNVDEEAINLTFKEIEDGLQSLCKTTAESAARGAEVSIATSSLPMTRAVFEVLKEEHVDLIIFGADSDNFSASSYVNTGLIEVAKASPVPVIVVPSTYTFQPIQSVLLPFNQTTIPDLYKTVSAEDLLHLKELKLFLLDLCSTNKNKQVEEERKHTLQSLFQHFNYELLHGDCNHVLRSITETAKSKNVQMTIALPRKASFLYNLTHKDIAGAIYKNIYSPVLILK